MNNTKIITMSLLGLASTGLLVSESQAFSFSNNTSEERFQEMRAMYLSANSVEDFKVKMEAKRAERKAEREAFRKSVTKTIKNLSNGVEVTLTSDNETVVEKLQNRSERKIRNNEQVTKTKTNLENGIQILITTDNMDLVPRIQERAQKSRKKGHKHHFGRKHRWDR